MHAIFAGYCLTRRQIITYVGGNRLHEMPVALPRGINSSVRVVRVHDRHRRLGEF